MIVHKSRKKAVCITVAGFLAGIAGGLILYYVRDAVLGWCFVATAGFTLLYGIGSLYDRRPYIVLTEDGITEMFTIRGQIEWEAIRYADDFYFRGNTGCGCCSRAITSRSSYGRPGSGASTAFTNRRA